MELLRQWAVGLCCAAVAAGVAQMAAPGGRMNPMFRTVLGLFFLCCAVSPLSGQAFRMPEDVALWLQEEQQQVVDMEQQAQSLFYRQAEETLAAAVVEKLEALGIKGGRAAVYIDETAAQLSPGDIVAEAVLPAQYQNRHSELCSLLSYELGITVRLGYEE